MEEGASFDIACAVTVLHYKMLNFVCHVTLWEQMEVLVISFRSSIIIFITIYHFYYDESKRTGYALLVTFQNFSLTHPRLK